MVVDNLRNTPIETKEAIEEITGHYIEFYELDAKNLEAVAKKFVQLTELFISQHSKALVNPLKNRWNTTPKT